ncbi:MAG: potassium transporter KtrB [Phycisphaerales bacterium]|nr:potassium transporter KtrB [Phycisphaerales bacterium]
MAPRENRPTDSETLSEELNTARPGDRAWRRPLVAAGRVASWAVMAPPRASLRVWSRLRPAQQLVLGFGAYSAIGTALLSLPWSQHGRAPVIDHAFNAVSAISTTGLTTISVPDRYTFAGQLVLLMMFQIGGVGFMTLSSLLILARGRRLSDQRLGVLKTGFSVPRYFVMQHFLVHVVVFTALCEASGALLLWWRFAALGVEHPLWSAVFHSVSAFATAGFSLNNDSMAAFAGDWPVNLVVGVLCYLGAIGFIVAQDAWYSIRLRERMLTFTSRVILTTTAAVFVVGTLLLFFLEPSVHGLPMGRRLLASAFQVMTASSTAGFNTIPIGSMSASGLVVVVIAMLIGASPSGTGGGIKTTSVSAILGNLCSVMRGRTEIVWLGHEIPLVRVLYAFAASSLYLLGLCVGVLVLCCTERQPFIDLVFESASAIGTVGLSMGITGGLSVAGKLTVIALMFAGRCGPLTIGLALLRPDRGEGRPRGDDLAV